MYLSTTQYSTSTRPISLWQVSLTLKLSFADLVQYYAHTVLYFYVTLILICVLLNMQNSTKAFWKHHHQTRKKQEPSPLLYAAIQVSVEIDNKLEYRHVTSLQKVLQWWHQTVWTKYLKYSKNIILKKKNIYYTISVFGAKPHRVGPMYIVNMSNHKSPQLLI